MFPILSSVDPAVGNLPTARLQQIVAGAPDGAQLPVRRVQQQGAEYNHDALNAFVHQ
jgi:hypothetical protein